MKKNVIFMLVDSVFFDCVGKGRSETSSTPFLDEMLSNGVLVQNLYSQGPYTDAATNSLFTGQNILDEYGYYYQLNNKSTNMYKSFHDREYETFGFIYPYYLFGNSVLQKIDRRIYTGGFVFSSVWNGKFSYYANLKKQNLLVERDYQIMIKEMKLVFESWECFYADILNNKNKNEIDNLLKIDNNEACLSEQKLKCEIEKFNCNNKGYIDNLLTLGENHPLADIDCVCKIDIKDESALKYVYKKYNSFFKKIKKEQKYSASRFVKPSFFKTFEGIISFFKNGFSKDSLMFLANYFLCKNSVRDMIKKSKRSKWQNISSARKQLRAASDVLSKKSDNTPFFMTLHFLDPHEDISFFSYDIPNSELLDQEFEILDDFIKSNNSKIRGNIIYQLSLRYVDFCIQEFYNKLKSMNLLEDTIFVVVADHGSSYTHIPLHGRHVNNFYRENYNIPCYMFGLKNGMKIKDGFHMSKDILPTILELSGNVLYESFSGNNCFDYSYPYVITEYMGPGCPDIFRRQSWLSIRNNRYMVACKAVINDNINITVEEIYDLVCDPEETKNLKKELKNSPYVLELLGLIRKRCQEIQHDLKDFEINLSD